MTDQEKQINNDAAAINQLIDTCIRSGNIFVSYAAAESIMQALTRLHTAAINNGNNGGSDIQKT